MTRHYDITETIQTRRPGVTGDWYGAYILLNHVEDHLYKDCRWPRLLRYEVCTELTRLWVEILFEREN
jgi:hypothetical protein